MHTLTSYDASDTKCQTRRVVPQDAGAQHAAFGLRRTRIVIADEHGVVREGLTALLSQQPGMMVTGEASDGYLALHLCRTLLPDVVIMDLQLSSLDGIDVISLIRRRCPRVKILVLSGAISEARAAAALDAGAQAYVLKRSGLETLKSALSALERCKPFLDPWLDANQIAALRQNEATERRADSKSRLTPRERQILKLIAEGGRNREIAEKLTISQKTVESHRLNMMQKLQAHNAAELSQWARRLGLMSVD